MMKKGIRAAVCALLTVFLTAGCGRFGGNAGSGSGLSSSGGVITLTFAEFNPLEDTISGAMDLKFKEEVERLSGGTIEIDIQGAAALGVEADVFDRMAAGKDGADLCRVYGYTLEKHDLKKSALLSLPYTFSDREHFWNFAGSELGREFLNEPEEMGVGVRGLYFGEEGFRHFFTAAEKSVALPGDMEGLKIRVSNNPVRKAMVQNLGAEAASVPLSDVYYYLEKGEIDGSETRTEDYAGNRFQEVAPNLTLDGHTLDVMMTVITDSAWDRLSEEQQGWILEAGKAASEYCREISEQKENDILKQLRDEGVNVIEITDKTEWREACRPAAAEAAGELAEVYQQILDLDQ